MDELEAAARKERESTQLKLSCFVVGAVSLSWFFGTIGFSYMWCMLIIIFVFTVYYRKNCRILEGKVREAEIKVHRKKALRDEETAEWLNFIINRWWNFSEVSLCHLIRSSLNPVLDFSRPAFIESMELVEFSFGKRTPFVKYVKVFENISDEGDTPNMPATENNVFEPPSDITERQKHMLVFNMDLCMQAPDTSIVIRVRLGGKMMGADVDVVIEDVSLSGRAQIVIEMDHLVPFPHMKSVAITFLERPAVGFDVRMAKAVQVMDIPMLKDFINALVMDSLEYALVDPGRIEIPLYAMDTDVLLNAPRKTTYACGVLTVTVKGGLPQKFTDDVIWTEIKVGDQEEKSSEKILGGTSWEDSFSFLVYDLALEKLTFEIRGKRTFGTKYTMAKYKVFLNSLNLEKRKKVETTLEKEGVKGSKLEVTLEYSVLQCLDVSSRTDENEFKEKVTIECNNENRAGILLIVLHSGSKLLAMDSDGYSDPYCIITSNKEKIKQVHHVSRTVNPVWEAIVEFPVRDFTQYKAHDRIQSKQNHLSLYKNAISFLLYDRDVNWQLQSDDFMGSCNFCMNIIWSRLLSIVSCYGLSLNNDLTSYDTSISSSSSVRESSFSASVFLITIDEPIVIKRKLNVNYKVFGKKKSEDSTMNAGSIVVSAVFRPVAAVEKSEMPGTANPVEDGEDIPDINEHAKRHTSKSSQKIKRQVEEMRLIKERGVLILTLLKGKDMIAMDSNGLSDPFCVVKINNEKKFKTNVAYETLAPVWNESVTVAMPTDTDKLVVEVFDKDVFQNDFMGQVTLTIDQIREAAKKVSTWYKLQDVESGEIQLQMKVSSQGEKVAEAQMAIQAMVDVDNADDSGFSETAPVNMFDETINQLERMIEVEPPPIYYSLSGEVIQASDIQGWGTVQIKGRISIPRKARKGSVKHEPHTIFTTQQMAPESGMVKWNHVFQTSGGIAIPNDAVLVFDMRDAKKKIIGICKISIIDFFKGLKRKGPIQSNNEEKHAETKWLGLEYDGNPVGRLQVMMGYSETPDAPLAPTMQKRRLIVKRFSSNPNIS